MDFFQVVRKEQNTNQGLIQDLVFSVAVVFSFFFSAIITSFILSIYAFKGLRPAIIVFFLSSILGIANEALFTQATSFLMYRYFPLIAVVFSVFIHVVVNGRVRVNISLFMIFVCTLFIFFHSLFFSHHPSLSLIKGSVWGGVVISLLLAWLKLSDNDYFTAEKVIFIFFSTIFICSLFTLFFPQISYFRNGIGFQGIINHPQAFGPVIASYIILVFRFIGRKNIRIASLLIISSMAMVILSESRGATLSLCFSLALSLAFLWTINQTFRKKFKFLIIVILFLTPLVFFVQFDFFMVFITKSGRVDTASLQEAFWLSRGALIGSMLENIENNLWFGIGLGIPSSFDYSAMVVDPVFNLPVSLPIEKGVFAFAIVEELGVLGSIIFILMFLTVIYRVRHAFWSLAILIFIILINQTEYVFFSTGGVGGLLVGLFVYAVSNQKNSKRRFLG